MYCSVPVFLAHRPDVTYGFFLNALGWSQIRCEPGSGTWVAEVAGRELDYVVAHGDGPAAVLERLDRAARPDRAAAALGDRLSPVALGLRLRRQGAQRGRRVRAPWLAVRRFHLDIDYMDGHRAVHVEPRALSRSGRADRRARRARVAVRHDRRPRGRTRAGQRGVRCRARTRRLRPRCRRRARLGLRLARPLRAPRLPPARRARLVG